MYSTTYEVTETCQTVIVSHSETGKRPSTAQVKSEVAAAAVTRSFKMIHSSQTIQDIVNLDISTFRYAHERGLYSGKTSFTGYRLKGATAGNLTWNHVTGSSFGTYTSADTQYTASAFAQGSFHSDFVWCNLQPGQDFTLYTRLTSTPTSYDAIFTQSRKCTGTHMATDKKMDTKYVLW